MFHKNIIIHWCKAWELWNSKRALELIDPSLGCPPDVAPLRCINIGLLCIEENPNDRPAMSDVVSMLGNELAALPSPKQPAFTAIRPVINTKSISSNDQKFSVYGLTISSVEPRWVASPFCCMLWFGLQSDLLSWCTVPQWYIRCSRENGNKEYCRLHSLY